MIERYRSSQISARRPQLCGAIAAALLLVAATVAAAQSPIDANVFGAESPADDLPALALEPVDPFAPPADTTPALNSVLPPRPAATPVSTSVVLAEPEQAGEKGAEKKTPSPKSSWLDLSTEKWTVKLGGHVQVDYINWAACGRSAGARAKLLRVPPLAIGGRRHGLRRVTTSACRSTSSRRAATASTSPVADIKDAYFSMNEIPIWQRWRIGNFFVPFSLEQVTNDTNNIFLERSIPTQGIFTADREVGMAFYDVQRRPEHHLDQRRLLRQHQRVAQGTHRRQPRAIASAAASRGCRTTTKPSNGRYLVHTGAGVLLHGRPGRSGPLPRSAADSRRTVLDRQRATSRPRRTRPAMSNSRRSGASAPCRARAFCRERRSATAVRPPRCTAPTSTSATS